MQQQRLNFASIRGDSDETTGTVCWHTVAMRGTN